MSVHWEGLNKPCFEVLIEEQAMNMKIIVESLGNSLETLSINSKSDDFKKTFKTG